MNKLITIISFALAIASFVDMFFDNLLYSCIAGIFAFILISFGFWIETKIRNYGNDLINQIIYMLSPNEKDYNIISKHFTYECLPNNEYKFTKHYVIKPKCNNLDRINDRFSWSAPSQGAKIDACEKTHEVNSVWQQDMWTYYSIYFNKLCEKNKPYNVGGVVSNLIDTNQVAYPYISSVNNKKTKSVSLVVKIPKDIKPVNAQLKVYSPKKNDVEVKTEELQYDDTIQGFSKTIFYPRKGWKYVISWKLEK